MNKGHLEDLIQNAKSGKADAQYMLGNIYKNGAGVRKNYIKAKFWYQRAVENGHIGAMNNLGVMLMFLGYEQNSESKLKESFQMFKRAATLGHPSAQNTLAVMLEVGFGAGKDLETALFWYDQAANLGHEMAEDNIEALQKKLKGLKESKRNRSGPKFSQATSPSKITEDQIHAVFRSIKREIARGVDKDFKSLDPKLSQILKGNVLALKKEDGFRDREKSVSQNHIISDKYLGIIITHALRHMRFLREKGGDDSNNLLESKKQALFKFLGIIFSDKESNKVSELRGRIDSYLQLPIAEGHSKLDGIVNDIGSQASDNAMVGNSAVNVSVGGKMDASYDIQGRLLEDFAKIRDALLELGQVLTKLEGGLRSEYLQDIIIEAISPKIIDGRCQSSIKPYKGGRGEKYREAPFVIGGARSNFYQGEYFEDSNLNRSVNSTPTREFSILSGRTYYRKSSIDQEAGKSFSSDNSGIDQEAGMDLPSDIAHYIQNLSITSTTPQSSPHITQPDQSLQGAKTREDSGRQ